MDTMVASARTGVQFRAGLFALALLACFHARAELVSIPYVDFDGTPRFVEADLTEPAGGRAAKSPALVILHHRGGWGAGTTRQYAQLAAQRGAVALELRMFDRTPANPLRHLSQAYAALAFLAGKPGVDGTRISVIGMSYGASLAIYAATTWAAQRFGTPGLKFDRHAGLYPTCFFHEGIIRRDPKIGARLRDFGFADDFHDRWLASPVRIYQAADDTFEDSDPAACGKFVAAIADPDSRKRFEVVVWPGASHGWDIAGSATYFDPLGCRFRGCEVRRVHDPSVTARTQQDLVKFLGLD